MENIITSIIGLIASVVMLVFSIWYIRVSLEINKARQNRIYNLKAYLDELKTNTKSEFKNFIDTAKEAENKQQLIKQINHELNEKGIYTIEVPKDLNEFDLSWNIDIDENKIKFIIKKP